MTLERLRTIFLVDAAFSAVAAVLFLVGTWDGLYDALDLPQSKPAIGAQLGGAVLVGVAYLLWLAARIPALMLPVARASVLMNGLSVGVIVAWLVKDTLGIGTGGKVALVVAAVLMAFLTAVYLAASVRHGGYGPEPPPAP